MAKTPKNRRNYITKKMLVTHEPKMIGCNGPKCKGEELMPSSEFVMDRFAGKAWKRHRLCNDCRRRKKNLIRPKKKVMRANKQRYNEKYPEKRLAHRKANEAVRKGELVRGPCCVCGTTEKVASHHFSYDEEHWLNVVWMCQEHHNDHHIGRLCSGDELKVVEEVLKYVQS